MKLSYVKNILGFSFLISAFFGCQKTIPNDQLRFASASQNGDIGTVKNLLQKGGIDINSQNGKIGPALITASYGGHKQVVQILLENGADINIRDINGATPLMNAVISSKPEIVKILIEKGANLNLTVIDKNGQKTDVTALKLAETEGNKEIIEILKRLN
jgi:uncharacterized protein